MSGEAGGSSRRNPANAARAHEDGDLTRSMQQSVRCSTVRAAYFARRCTTDLPTSWYSSLPIQSCATWKRVSLTHL